MTEQPIISVSDAAFDLQVYYAACRTAEDCPEHLTDAHLAHLAVYSRDHAQRARTKKIQALEELERKRLFAQAQAATPPRARASQEIRENDSWDDIVKRAPHKPVTLTTLDAFMTAVFTFTRTLKKKNGERDDQIADLQRQILALKDAPRLTFRGDWEPGAAYVRGDLTTHHGSCWHCEIDATGLEPTTSGLGASAWKMFVSRGRPGKDAR